MGNIGKWKFKDIHNYGYPYYHIHPHKQKAVKHMVDNKPDWIRHILVFGSSVGNWHTYESDLDVCVVGLNPTGEVHYRKNMHPSICGVDFLEYESLDMLIKEGQSLNNVAYDIVKEGVIVYGEY